MHKIWGQGSVKVEKVQIIFLLRKTLCIKTDIKGDLFTCNETFMATFKK